MTGLTITDKAVNEHAVKAYGGRRCVAPLILNLGTGCRSVVNVTPRWMDAES
jgi:hypothetical protein